VNSQKNDEKMLLLCKLQHRYVLEIGWEYQCTGPALVGAGPNTRPRGRSPWAIVLWPHCAQWTV